MGIDVNILIYAILESWWLVYALMGSCEEFYACTGLRRRLRVFAVGSLIFTLIWGGIFW